MQVRTGLPLANTAAHKKSRPSGRCLFFNFGMLFARWLACRMVWRIEWDDRMEPKIAVLFILIASVIGLSHLSEDFVGRMRRQLGEGRWREILPRRRRV